MTSRFSTSTLTLLLRWRLRQRRSLHPPATAAPGLTLIECLVAIVVIAITVAAITPPIFLATATRIQARRGEQANQIAQGEVDRIRQLVERGVKTTDEIPADLGGIAAKDAPVASGSSGLLMSPSSTCNSYPPATPVSGTSLVPVDIDGDCKPEFAMQVYRTKACTPASVVAQQGASAPPYAFQIGVRVYTYREGEILPTLSAERASLGLAAGKRDNGAVRRPMQVLYSRVAQVNSGESLECSGGG